MKTRNNLEQSFHPFSLLRWCYFSIHNIFAITLFSFQFPMQESNKHHTTEWKKRTHCSLLTTNHKLLKSRTVTERWEWNMVRDKSWKQVTSEPRIFTFCESDSSEAENAINFRIPFRFPDDDFSLYFYVKVLRGSSQFKASHRMPFFTFWAFEMKNFFLSSLHKLCWLSIYDFGI